MGTSNMAAASIQMGETTRTFLASRDALCNVYKISILGGIRISKTDSAV